MTSPRPPLFTFRFFSLCLFMLLAYCNIAVFYNLYPYLESLGVPQQWRGSIIGSSALATIAGFLLITPRQSLKTAPRAIYLGSALLIACGMGYLIEQDIPGLFALRLINGVGIALLTSSATTLLVAHIAPERSGQAFGVYSIAALVPYSIVPFAFDHLGALLPSPAHGYALMSMTLVPAAALNFIMQRQARAAKSARPDQCRGSGTSAMLHSLRTPQTGLLLLLNIVYYLNFSALFFLSKSLFHSRNLGSVGMFFTIQTVLMLLVRVLGSRLFDEVKKPLLVLWCYGFTAVGFGMLWGAHTQTMVVASALVLGLGMGVGPPSLNALMYALTDAPLKAVNSNLMVMALQAGNFLGPLLGGVAVGVLGYPGFLAVCMAVNLGGMWLALIFLRRGWTGDLRRQS